MRIIALAVLALAMVSGVAQASDEPRYGKETVIDYAANGGITNWEAGPPDSGIIYLRDRRLSWYRVALTGPCITDPSLDTLTFNTDVNGRFDRFSSISVSRYPGRKCGVTSIQTSPPPPGQRGGPKAK